MVSGAAQTWLIRGGRVVDPASGRDEVANVLVHDGRVVAVGAVDPPAGASVFDAEGLVVAPGLVDLHVHLRVPGQEAKETIASGTAAAAAGGFTTICCMPNTEPPLDTPAILRELAAIVARQARVRVHPIAAISQGRLGEEPTDYAALAAAGAVGFSDDGVSTRAAAVLRVALAATRAHGRPVMEHCEDWTAPAGAMHEGDISHQLGIAGQPAATEERILERDLKLAAEMGGWLHALHVSTAGGVELVRRFKAAGARVTAEVMPHHLTMTDAWVAGDRTLVNTDALPGMPGRPGDPNTKVNPPLRTLADTRALLAGLRDGTIDVVATDHAPHEPATKAARPFAEAAPGLIGLEVAVPLLLALVRAGELSLSQMIDKLSAAPARLLADGRGTLAPGTVADLIVVDPDEPWTVTAETLRSKSKNTPLLGMTLRGRVQLMLVDGQERYRA